MSAETIILLIGLAFNFVAMLVGGLGMMLAGFRWFSSMHSQLSVWLANIGERLAALETDVKYLREQTGKLRDGGDSRPVR